MKKPTHGGRRKNAGRPKLGKVVIFANVQPITKKLIQAHAKLSRKTMGEIIDNAFSFLNPDAATPQNPPQSLPRSPQRADDGPSCH